MTTATQPPGTGQVELVIGGMTCASCANRIEKKLNKLDGVTATVNYATEKARVDVTGDVSPAELIATVEQAGYSATLPTPPPRKPLLWKQIRPPHCGPGCWSRWCSPCR
ncbi:putative copper-transporting ATPase CopA [Nocardia brasiliensis NBRC 14402]|nr:putative copper-transporting ATPase CopA [Nocardia brasiliensis NBRC 14402]